MDIAIIGGGVTGLTAAYELLKSGHKVTVFEKEKTLGGLAAGFRPTSTRGDASSTRLDSAKRARGGQPLWDWHLEQTYHHFFTNDTAIISLAKELGLEKDLMILSPTTSVYWNKKQYPFDTPLTILKFPGIPFIDRLRTGMTAAIMKLNPFWKPLEAITAKNLFRMINGENTWNTIWEPLLDAKFGPYADQVPASWLWARLHKRTMNLGYFRGGFQTFIDSLADAIEKQGGIIITNSAVTSIKQDVRSKKYEIRIIHNNSYVVNRTSYFDKVLITTPSSIATKLIKFSKSYEQRLHAIPHLWAQTLILETNEPILDKTYWLNINDRTFPFLAVVAHTNMIDKKYYGGHYITYIGNYLPDDHPFLKMTKQQLLKKFLPYLKKINPSFLLSDRLIVSSSLFTVPFAQPVHTLNYSTKVPPLKTPIDGIYLANLDSIYPWDRGINYAVELGQKAAQQIQREKNFEI